MTRPVTAGLDGSLESLAAAHWAAREARLRHLPLRLVHAWEWLPDQPPPRPSDPWAKQYWPTAMMREAVDEITSRNPDLPITAEQIVDRPAPALVAQAQQSELLVLGSRGLAGVTGFLVGSVALAVVARAERPVVLVRADGGRDEPRTVRDVVVGIDLDHPSGAVIQWAFETADARWAPLRVLCARDTPPSRRTAGGPGLHRAAGNEDRAALLAALHPGRERHLHVAVHDQLVLGHPARHLVRAAAGAGLLIVGRRTQRPPMAARLGTVAHAVLHHAPCPVAVVPHD